MGERDIERGGERGGGDHGRESEIVREGGEHGRATE